MDLPLVDRPVEVRALATTAPAGPTPVLLTCVICEDELRSARTGRLTVRDLAYVWTTSALPLRVDLDVVTLWWIRAIERPYRFMTRVRDLDGGVLDLVESEMAFEKPAVHEQMARFAMLEFQAGGVYRVEVLLDDDVVGTYPLFVQVVESDTAAVKQEA
ncbi:hypothetical protein PLCT1_01610 [Planctomycetaceae bacterium]|nr:hypothetical protein PLCT1_01610 [Planctomycetaceae bacterium]